MTLPGGRGVRFPPDIAPGPPQPGAMDITIAAHIVGTDPEQLSVLRATGIDHHGLPVESFVDTGGGWPLRCCLRDSTIGDELAIVAWSPFSWNGAYRTTGPIVIHARACAQPSDGSFPPEFADRRQVLRAYGADDRLVYDLNRIVEPGEGLAEVVDVLLADPRVEFVQSFSVLSGCYSFTAHRR
jgi:Protein of unknown function (DUF1203)